MPRTQEAADLDQAWAAINALGGISKPADRYDAGFGDAIDAALQCIEGLGGMSVASRTIADADAAAERDKVGEYHDWRREQG